MNFMNKIKIYILSLFFCFLSIFCSISYAVIPDGEFAVKYKSSSDCASLTNGKFTDFCWDTTLSTIFKCIPGSDDTCNTPDEWQKIQMNGASYPGAGIPVSTGTSWDNSITNNSSNWNTAYEWGNHALAGYLTASALTPYLTSETAAATYQTKGAYLTSITTSDVLIGLGTPLSPLTVDLSLYAKTSDLSSYVPKTTSINGHALSSSVTVTPADIGLGSVENAAASGLYVPLTRKINGTTLTSDVTISPSQWTTSGGTTIYYNGGNVGIGTTSPSAPLTIYPAGAYSWGTGGDVVYNVDAGGGVYYRVHKFTTIGNSTFTPASGLSTTYTALVIAGGGGGGTPVATSGGGGAGGVVYNSNVTISSATTVTVGDGGTQGNNGSNSVVGSIVALGGGAGGAGGAGASGGSGGGGTGYYAGAGGMATQGNSGGGIGYGFNGGSGGNTNYRSGGGGGGAGGAGQNAQTSHGGNGGAGYTYALTGECFAGGGGGGGDHYTSSIVGPSSATCGGGAGGYGTYPTAVNGTPGTAGTGGGGGAGNNQGNGGKGGSGIVIIAYQIPSMSFSLPSGAVVNGTVSIGKTAGATSTLELQGVGTTNSTSSLKITDASETIKFLIQDNGNVGIGTSVPRQKLDVDGTVYMKGNVGIGTLYPAALLDVQGSFIHKCTSGIGKASCHYTGGFDGYCSSVVAADGSCTCNVCN